jgi:hypothetical protein
METILISDELYKKLKYLSNEIKTQDNRKTASPYFYQIMETKEDSCWEENADKIIWYHSDGEYKVENVFDEMVTFLKENGEDCLNGWEDAIAQWNLDEIDEYDLEDMFKYLGFYKVPIKTVYQFSNAFLTEKSIIQHIESNKHHYENPKTYLQYAYRNSDLETIFEFLKIIE